MLSASELSEIKERERKATPGPWDNRCREFSNTELPRNVWANYGWVCKTENCDQVHNAEFIAHSREDIPRLVEALENALEVIKYCANDHMVTKAREFLKSFEGDEK